jgi:hypothetical protein
VSEEELYILRRMINTSIGHASTCWEKLELAGKFDSTEAKKISEELEEKICKLIKDARIEALTDYLSLGPDKAEILIEAIKHEKR